MSDTKSPRDCCKPSTNNKPKSVTRRTSGRTLLSLVTLLMIQAVSATSAMHPVKDSLDLDLDVPWVNAPAWTPRGVNDPALAECLPNMNATFSPPATAAKTVWEGGDPNSRR